MCYELASNFVPQNVLCEWPCTEDTDAIVATPEGGVGDEDGWVRYEILFWNRDGVELFANPDVRVAIIFSELCKRLLLFNVFFPKRCIDSGIPPR